MGDSRRRSGYLMVPVRIEYSWIDDENGIMVHSTEMPSNEVISYTYATMPIVYRTEETALEDRFRKNPPDDRLLNPSDEEPL